ncbi:hypothetical protein RF11_07708 [Thelohanellus kitauei]|uniref:Uncharacterized protein n=1 Tax=Thelohanellus kitauei TaxID=669202 RepID=A0A0C2MST7_THEKT|nr:hypothetical protein RF11_07708 [Thelohanellus kitauei]
MAVHESAPNEAHRRFRTKSCSFRPDLIESLHIILVSTIPRRIHLKGFLNRFQLFDIEEAVPTILTHLSLPPNVSLILLENSKYEEYTLLTVNTLNTPNGKVYVNFGLFFREVVESRSIDYL